MKYRVNEKLGKKIKRARKLRRISQEALAEKTGLHYTTVSRIERGVSNPPVYTTFKIARVLKIWVCKIQREVELL